MAVTSPTPELAVLIEFGPCGTPAGVTALEAALHAPQPSSFCARTRNVYDVPLLRPVNVWGLAVAVWVAPPDASIWIWLIAQPWSPGAV